MAKKTIYLDEENKEKWEKLFDQTGRNASKWISEKLEEEEKSSIDPYLLKRRINELIIQKETIENELEQVKKRLIKSTKLQISDNCLIEIDYVQLKNMAIGISKTYNLDDITSSQLAKCYLSIEGEKPPLQKFMSQKLKELKNDDIK